MNSEPKFNKNLVPRAPKQKMLSNKIISTRQNLKYFTGRDIFNTQIFAVIGQKETATYQEKCTIDKSTCPHQLRAHIPDGNTLCAHYANSHLTLATPRYAFFSLLELVEMAY